MGRIDTQAHLATAPQLSGECSFCGRERSVAFWVGVTVTVEIYLNCALNACPSLIADSIAYANHVYLHSAEQKMSMRLWECAASRLIVENARLVGVRP